MGVGDENRCQCPQSADDGQSKKLVWTCQLVLGEATEIGHVDRKRREQADDTVESCQGCKRLVHIVGLDFDVAFDERAATGQLVSIIAFCKPGIVAYPLVTITAQRNSAKKVGGTTIALIQKKTRSFVIGMIASAVCMIQNRNKQSKEPATMELAKAMRFKKSQVLQSIPALPER